MDISLNEFSSGNICDQLNNPDINKHFTKLEIANYKENIELFEFSKGNLIIEEGSKPKGIYCVLEGTAKLFQVGFNGKEQILRFANAGEIIGYRSILCNEDFRASATALENMKIKFVPEDLFLKFLELSPKLAFEMLKRVSHELGEASRTITLLAQKNRKRKISRSAFITRKENWNG